MRRNVGEVVPSKNEVTSKIEETVRAALVTAGYVIPQTKMAVTCHHPDGGGRHLLLTPDVLLVEHKIAVEVDPCGVWDKGFTHTGAEDKDQARGELLGEAGWTVIRVRLGAKAGHHIGTRDVVVESSAFTKAAAAALVEAIDDVINHRGARVRLVKKAKAPIRGPRKIAVDNIAPNRYTEDGHYFRWYPAPSGIKQVMRLCVGGRYVYTGGRHIQFLEEVRLDEHPTSQWREVLAEALKDVDPANIGMSYPWGPSLFACHQDDYQGNLIVQRCDQTSSIDDVEFDFTTNCDTLAGWNDFQLQTADGTPLVWLLDEAFDLGYRILSAENCTGWQGQYQRITVSRKSSPR